MNRLLTALVVSATALWIAACSSGGSNVQPPPPAGKYSNASLNGQYAFTTSGEVFTGGFSAIPLSRVGTFTADGKGNITGGVEDTNAAGNVNPPALVTGGSYFVNPDGRGALRLNFGSTSIDFGITLTSTSDGLMIDETSNATQSSTGSGNFILQNSADFNISSVSGPYVFDFAGLDANQTFPCPCPESLVGQFSVSNGVINPGSFDDNDDTALTSNAGFTGTLSTDPLNPQEPITSSGRGIALIAGQNFVFYIVDSTRVRFISTNLGMLSGDAVLQSSTIPSSLSAINGNFAFIVAGSSANGGLTRVGRFTVSSGAINNILLDVNDAAVETQINNLTSGTVDSYDPATGRGTLTLQGSTATYEFVFYLSSLNDGVLQDVSPSNTPGFARVVADGSILMQSGSPFTSSNISGTYAMNWSGLVVAGGSFPIQDEEDLVAQVTVTNLNLSGTADIFQFTSTTLTPQFDLGAGGSITIAGDGGQRNSMTVNLSKVSPIHMVVYIVNPQLALFANSDNSGTQRIVVGVLKAQQ